MSCISKGKAHKKHEFGAKVTVSVTKTRGIINVGALSFQGNPFDGYALPVAPSQVESVVGQRSTIAIIDRGYCGECKNGVTSIEIPEPGRQMKAVFGKRQAKKRFRRRAAIESINCHLRTDHRMMRNYLQGQIGDFVDVFMACAAFNFRECIWILCFYASKSVRHVSALSVVHIGVCLACILIFFRSN